MLQKVAGLSLAEAGFATLLARFVQLWWGVLIGLLVGFVFRKRLFPPSLEATIAESQQQLVDASTEAAPPVGTHIEGALS